MPATIHKGRIRPAWLDLPHLQLRFGSTPTAEEAAAQMAAAVEAARAADVAVIFAGYPEGYETEYPGGKDVRYSEGIFVGYRYYDAKDVAPLFPFGHGLSYTEFAYSDLQVTPTIRPGEPVAVSVTVKNVGDRAGKEVVQLYVRDAAASLPRPPKELKRFAKISLAPGEAQTVRFELDERDLAFYDPYRKAWVAEPGEFEVLIGSSSHDIRARALLTYAVQFPVPRATVA